MYILLLVVRLYYTEYMHHIKLLLTKKHNQSKQSFTINSGEIKTKTNKNKSEIT